MQNKIIVLITSGKHESTDYARVVLFDGKNEAEDYCKRQTSGKTKYWSKAEIVKEDETIDLGYE